MTDRSIAHATFTVERTYPANPARVFAAWADPAAKAQWFAGPSGDHELDFRVGGQEVVHGKFDGKLLTFTSTYVDIIDAQRIAYSSTLHFDEEFSTASLTTVEFHADGQGTRLLLTEHDVFVDGHELPEWREEGTTQQLNDLGKYLDEDNAS